MRALVLSAAVGSGHMRAAQAVELALKESVPGARVRVVDVLSLADAPFRKAYGDGYLGLASAAPHLLGYLYDALDKPARSDVLRRLVQRFCLRDFPALLEEEPWDVVVNTHFLPAELLARLKEAGVCDLPQITVVTDFHAHRLWASLPCEHYFTASREASAALRWWGVPEDSVTVSGIPIHPVFSRLPEREDCLKSLGLGGDRPVVLQLSGGSGMGPIEKVYTGLLSARLPIELVVVTGRNAAARRRLLRLIPPSRHRVHILGYTERMHALMACADLVVSKPGGLTVSEALACGVPFVAVDPIPGQEGRNCDFLLESGAGLKINALPSLPEKLDALLLAPQRLARMRRAARAQGRPLAAYAVARKAWELARARRDIPGTHYSIPRGTHYSIDA